MNILRLNLPTALTLCRILLVPVFIFSVYQHQIFGAFIFAVASITDYLDGYFARHSGEITKLGIILDPIADKFLVVSALIVLVDLERLPAWIAIVIIVREFLVTGLRAVALSKNVIIHAEMGGKVKTFAQILAILCLILVGNFNIDFYGIGISLIWIALALSVISGIQYTLAFWRRI